MTDFMLSDENHDRDPSHDRSHDRSNAEGDLVNNIASLPLSPAVSEPEIPEPVGTDRTHYRTIWISDVHLGTKGCNADLLIDFLDHTDSETIYLVGDIIDGWRLKKKFYWPTSHNDVVWRIMKRAKRGTRVVYIPGNHDEMFRQFTGLNFGGVEIRRAAFHDTADGRRLMVLHGDEFDAVMLSQRWLAFVGDWAYVTAMKLNVAVNAVRKAMGKPYWSLSKAAKHKVKNAVEFIGKYEEVVAKAAGERGVDGVVCGHIHTAESRIFEFDGKPVEYWNDGDWVEGCNALVEHHDGRMEILNWPDVIKAREAAQLEPEAGVAVDGEMSPQRPLEAA
ncbi:MAG: UDP-2,3-diacylglucosamine diphosphatase [Pseudomonadota bacterium]